MTGRMFRKRLIGLQLIAMVFGVSIRVSQNSQDMDGVLVMEIIFLKYIKVAHHLKATGAIH